MNRSNRAAGPLAALWTLLTLTSCISSGPPAPPVRWLDPTADYDAPVVDGRAEPLGLRAQPHLGQEVAVRTEASVVVYDADHRWLVPPEELVRRAFGRAGVPLVGRAAAPQGELQPFELRQLVGAPAARVVCVVTRPNDPDAAPGVRVEVVAPAADASRGALTAAMADALELLVTRVLAATGP